MNGAVGEREVILKLDRFRGGVEVEARLLPLLRALGLPVPEVLAGPVTDPAHPELGSMTVLAALPGESLLRLLRRASDRDKAAYLELLMDGADQLREAGGMGKGAFRAVSLPERTLSSEFRHILESAGSLLEDPGFMSAGERLAVMLESTEAPLVLSNGDLNPSNFLSDGRRLTGIVDFGGSCWEDPLFGFAMCARVRWQAFDGEDLARRWAVRRGFTPVALEIRMALACMRRLVELEIVSTPLAALGREQVRERLRAACSNFP